MVRLEELDGDAPPDLEEIPGAEISVEIKSHPGLWLASEAALDEPKVGLLDKGVTHLLSFGALRRASPTRRHQVYERAENGALVTHLRAACDFVREAIEGGGGARGNVAVVSEEEGEDAAAFLIAAFLVVEKRVETVDDAVAAVASSRPSSELATHKEFAKNLKFLARNGIPDWA